VPSSSAAAAAASSSSSSSSHSSGPDQLLFIERKKFATLAKREKKHKGDCQSMETVLYEIKNFAELVVEYNAKLCVSSQSKFISFSLFSSFHLHLHLNVLQSWWGWKRILYFSDLDSTTS